MGFTTWLSVVKLISHTLKVTFHVFSPSRISTEQRVIRGTPSPTAITATPCIEYVKNTKVEKAIMST